MDDQKKPARGVYILPNLFTTASLFAAFVSVTYAISGRYEAAAMAVFVSALMDGLDGKVARLTHTASQFGIELDSLADVVAFGMAPAVLAWTWQLHAYGRLGLGVSFLYVVCAALRLARFNVGVSIVSKRFFIGLPSPAAGCMLAAFVLFIPYLPTLMLPALPQLTMFLCVLVPLLMVTRVRYFSFKEYGFLKAHPFRMLVLCMLVLVLLLSYPRFWAFIAGFCYILGGIAYTCIYLPRKNRLLLRRLNHPGEEQ